MSESIKTKTRKKKCHARRKQLVKGGPLPRTMLVEISVKHIKSNTLQAVSLSTQ
jgi:hypothetical protein